MLLSGNRFHAHHAPTNYKNILPERGCGFILKRIAEISAKNRPPMKEQVYAGTKWAKRPGFASLLWTSLMEDGLIASVDGKTEYNGAISPFSRSSRRYTRAKGHVENGKMVFRYYLLPEGREIYEEMMERVNKALEDKKEFCKRNGIQFSTGKVLDPILTEVPPGPAERKSEAWHKLDAIINELVDLRDSLS